MNKKQLEQFDKKFPKYTGIGSPYPIFENVNRNYIKQFISTLLKETRQDIIEIGDKMKKEIDDSDYFGISNDHRKQQKILNKQGYNNAISDYQTLIKTLTKQK